MSLFGKLFGKKKDKAALLEQFDQINARLDELEAEIRAKGDTPETTVLLEALRRERERIRDRFDRKDT